MTERKHIESNTLDDKRIGNVIRILDPNTLIVNAGSDVLQEGESVIVYEVLDEIYDLDGAFLGNYEHTKEKLKVMQVYDKFSVCQKMPETTISPAFLLSPMLENVEDLINNPVPLPVDEQVIKPLRPQTTTICIGDPVKKY